MPLLETYAVEALETQSWFQGRTEIVIAGLRALHGRCAEADARELAMALLAHLPANDLALKLVDALLAQAQIVSGNGSLLDVFAQGIAGRLPRINTAKLARFVARRMARTVPTLSLGRLAFVASVPLNQPVPLKPFPGQKVPPCPKSPWAATPRSRAKSPAAPRRCDSWGFS